MQIITKVQIKWFYANLLKIMKVSRLADKKYMRIAKQLVSRKHGIHFSPLNFSFTSLSLHLLSFCFSAAFLSLQCAFFGSFLLKVCKIFVSSIKC